MRTAARPVPAARSGRERRTREALAFAAVLLVAVAMRLPTLTQPLVEVHSYRQTQTAWTAVQYADHGIDLLHPEVPVVGPPFEWPMDFPLYQATASIPIRLGVDPAPALRTTDLVFFLLTAGLLFGLLRQVSTRLVAWAALLAFLFSPFALVWSRTSMIEYLATAAALGWVWAGIRWRETRAPGLLVVAILAGSVAMTVKVTTGAFWVFPLLLYHTGAERAGVRHWVKERVVAGAYLVAAPVVAGAAWIVHSDHIKDAHETTRPMTSTNLRTFNFGRFSDRFDLDRWRVILDQAGELLIGSGFVWLALILVALWSARRSPFWIGVALTAFVAPLVFFNLYYIHDYYLAAISPALAALLGLVAQWAWDHAPRPFPRSVAVATLAIAWLIFVYVPSRHDVQYPYETTRHDPTLAAAREIRELPPGLVIVTGTGLNPSALYHAGRKGLNLYTEIQTREVLDTLPGRYRALYAFDPDAEIVDRVLARSESAQRVGPHTWILR